MLKTVAKNKKNLNYLPKSQKAKSQIF